MRRNGLRSTPSSVQQGQCPAPRCDIQALRMIPVVTADPAPFDVAFDHTLTLIWSGTASGPAGQSSEVVNDALELLATIAMQVGADGLYSVRLTTAVDNGWMFVTATATASLPTLSAVRHPPCADGPQGRG
jgi:hypothetical protein